MAAKVYTFHITYEGLEDRIWRDVEVSSNYRLDRLGYMVLAAFDTMAYHLFKFEYNGRQFGLPDEEAYFEQTNVAEVELHRMGLELGDRIRMDYDFGTMQTFWLEMIAIRDMECRRGNHYPYVLDGAGRGILDDVACDDLAELIAQIDRNGKTDKPIYYQGSVVPWDYRRFDKVCANLLLKSQIAMIEEGYAPLLQPGD